MTDYSRVDMPTVRVVEMPDYFRKHKRTQRVVAWRDGMTVRDLGVPAWGRFHTTAFVGHAEATAESAVAPGDIVTFVKVPASDSIKKIAKKGLNIVADFLTGRLYYDFFHYQWEHFWDFIRPPLAPFGDNKRSNPVYSWAGPFTSYNSKGLPIPIVYGQNRVGGSAIVVMPEIIDGPEPQTYLNLVLLLAAGPIKAIAQYETDQDLLTADQGNLPDSLQIEGNDAENLNDVQVSLRMGTLGQEYMPGATFVPTTYDVGLLVDQVTQESGDTPVVDWSMAATFDMPLGQLADRSTFILSFPSGLWRVAADGSVKPETVEVQVRYQELNDAGNPIGNPVVATGASSFKITAKQSNAFQKQITVEHFNDTTFVAPTLTNMLRFEKNDRHRASSTLPWGLTWPAGWVAGAFLTEFSFVHFFTPREIKEHQPVFSMADWDEVESPAQGTSKVQGIIIDCRQKDAEVLEVQVLMGEGIASASQVEIRCGDLEANVGVFVAVTYKANVVSTTNRLRVYINGVLQKEVLTLVKLPVTSYLGGSLAFNTLPHKEAAGTGQWHGSIDHDEARIYNVELTGARIAQIHNQGFWRTISSTAEPDVVAANSFETGIAGFIPGMPAYGAASLSVQPTTPTLSSVTGLVTSSPSNGTKRARYRCQVQRTDAVKDGFNNHDIVRFQTLIAILDEGIAYAGCALMGLRILATDQLNTSFPRITVIAKGAADLPVFDGVDPETPNLVPGYNANPAWILAHLMLLKQGGAGHIYDTENVDWASFKEWADYCDARVYDMRGRWGGPHTDWDITLFYAATGGGPFPHTAPSYQLQLTKPVIPHLIAGKWVRIRNTTGTAWPEGDFEIRLVNDTHGLTTWRIVIDWPVGVATPSPTSQVDATVEVEGIEHRIECNLVLADTGLAYLDARQIIASVGRASISTLGDSVSARVMQLRQPIAAFNAANIARGSFQMTSNGTAERSNTAAVTFQNQDKDYSRDVAYMDHPSLEGGVSTLAIRRADYDYRGVTNLSQVLRETRLRLNISQQIKDAVQFGAALDALLIDIGDVFILNHPVPDWDHGSRLTRDSANTSELYVDVAFVIGQLNMFSSSKALNHADWTKAGGTPPTVGAAVADPLGALIAWPVTFASGGSNRIQQAIAHRGTGTVYTFIFWIKVTSGSTTDLKMEVLGGTTGTVFDTFSMTLSGSYQRQARTLTATTSIAADPTVIARIIRGSSGGNVVASIAWPRIIIGPDDGLDAENETVEATGVLPTIYAAVPDSNNDNAISWGALAVKAGQVAAGERLVTSAPLAHVPKQGQLWFVGPLEFAARQWEVTSISPAQDFRVDVTALQYDETVFPDEDDWPTISPSTGDPATFEAATFDDTILPQPPTFVSVVEEDWKDPVTGHLQKGLFVSWSYDRGTAHRVEKARIWLRDVDEGGQGDVVGEVHGSATNFRLQGRGLERGTRYEVAVQPVTRSGLAIPRRHAPAARLTYQGLWPMPGTPAAGRALHHGEMATYEIDPPADYQDIVGEVMRGGLFVGQLVGRIPRGSSVLGPTSDWCILTAADDGRTSPPLFMRVTTAQGSKSDWLRVDPTFDPADFGYVNLLADNMEDGPWNVANSPYVAAPVLTGLSMQQPADPNAPQRLHFTDVGSGSTLTGRYQSTAYDLGRARTVHVSFGVFGVQVEPTPFDTLPTPGSLRDRTRTTEGWVDRGHPDYAGELTTALEWSFSRTSSDPGTTWRAFRCGVHNIRSCRFRISVTRPTNAWDVWITRAGMVLRAVPHSTDFDGGGAT